MPCARFSFIGALLALIVCSNAAQNGTESETLLNGIKNSKIVDLCFVVDSTGSMGSYIGGVRESILAIVGNLTDETAEVQFEQLRLSFVGYRDEGDQPEFEVLPFTSNVTEFQEFVKGIQASGGGDAPENVPGGLSRAIALKWNPKAGVRVMFHMADEPCHSSSDQRIYYRPGPEPRGFGPRIHETPDTNASAALDTDASEQRNATGPYCLAQRGFPTELEIFAHLGDQRIEYNFGKITDRTNEMLLAFEKACGKKIAQFDVAVAPDRYGTGDVAYRAAGGKIYSGAMESVYAAYEHAENTRSPPPAM